MVQCGGDGKRASIHAGETPIVGAGSRRWSARTKLGALGSLWVPERNTGPVTRRAARCRCRGDPGAAFLAINLPATESSETAHRLSIKVNVKSVKHIFECFCAFGIVESSYRPGSWRKKMHMRRTGGAGRRHENCTLPRKFDVWTKSIQPSVMGSLPMPLGAAIPAGGRWRRGPDCVTGGTARWLSAGRVGTAQRPPNSTVSNGAPSSLVRSDP